MMKSPEILFFWPLGALGLMVWLIQKTGMIYVMLPWFAIVLVLILLPFGNRYLKKITNIKSVTARGKGLLGIAVASTLMCILMTLAIFLNLFFKQIF